MMVLDQLPFGYFKHDQTYVIIVRTKCKNTGKTSTRGFRFPHRLNRFFSSQNFYINRMFERETCNFRKIGKTYR